MSEYIKYWRHMKLLADIQNLGVSWKYRQMPKILTSHENLGGCSKYWRLMNILAGIQNIWAPGKNIGIQ